jgi:virginiamycin B lyase
MSMLHKIASIVFIAIGVAGCSAMQPVAAPQSNVTPALMSGSGSDVLQGGGQRVHWVILRTPGNNVDFQGLTVGPDRAMWAADYLGTGLVRIAMNGLSKRFTLPNFYPQEIVLGDDGDFYLNTPSGQARILRVTTTGVTHVFALPDLEWAYGVMAVGPDDKVWFTEQQHLGSLSPGGTLTQYSIPSGCNDASGGVAAGPDGNMWYTTSCVNVDRVVKINPRTGASTSYPVSACPAGGQPIVTGPDDNLWFTCNSNAGLIAKISTSGHVTTYQTPSVRLISLTAGPDGNIWYVEDLGTGSRIGKVDPTTGHTTLYQPPCGRLAHITSGPDGNVWMDTGADLIVYVLKVMKVIPTSPTFNNAGQSATLTVTEKGTSSWTAASSDLDVASVAQGQRSDQFVVTSTGSGQCIVSIKDAIGNIFDVRVSVQ